MSAVIGAERDRVWRALTVPDEMIRWDARMVAILDSPEGYPRIGEKVRWRYRLGKIPIILTERPLEVAPGERLRAAITLGLIRFEETYTLDLENDAARQTRLTLKLCAKSEVPMMGGVVDRFDVRRMATELIDERLRSVQKWCEEQP